MSCVLRRINNDRMITFLFSNFESKTVRGYQLFGRIFLGTRTDFAMMAHEMREWSVPLHIDSLSPSSTWTFANIIQIICGSQ